MNQPYSEFPPVREKPVNSTAITAVVLSAMGLFGWGTLVVMLIPYEETASGDVGAFASNVFTFGFNFMLLTIGSVLSGTLSFSGLLMGALSHGNRQDRLPNTAVALGAAGLLAGAFILSWRFEVLLG